MYNSLKERLWRLMAIVGCIKELFVVPRNLLKESRLMRNTDFKFVFIVPTFIEPVYFSVM